MHQLFACFLIAVAYCPLVLAMQHSVVQGRVVAGIKSHVKTRATATNWKKPFVMGDLSDAETDYFEYLTVNVDNHDILVLRLELNGAELTSGVDQPVENAVYTKPVSIDADKVLIAYGKGKERFLGLQLPRIEECDSYASAQVVFDVKVGEQTLGTFVGIAFSGYKGDSSLDDGEAVVGNIELQWPQSDAPVTTLRACKINH